MSRYDSSHEALDLLNKKHFGSLVDVNNDLTYSTGQLGKIPLLYPRLLKNIRQLLAKPEERFDPGIAVIMRQMGSKTTPSNFVTFGKQLNSGFMTIGSFSPRKKTNWLEVKELIVDLGEECDHLLEDFQDSAEDKWTDYQYDVTTRLVSEQAEIVNTALRMHSTLEYGISQKYVCTNALLGYIELNFTKAPLNMRIKFSEEDKDQQCKNLIKEIKRVSLRPINYLNDESLANEDLDHIDAYIERFFDLLGTGRTFSEIQSTIDKVTQHDSYQAKQFKVLLKRYYGVILTPIIIDDYFEHLKIVIKESSAFTTSFDVKILDHYAEYLKENWRRKYYLGLVRLDKDYQSQIIDSIYQELEKYAQASKMDTVQKNTLNNGINTLDTKISNGKIELGSPNFLIDIKRKDLQYYLIKDIIEPSLENDTFFKSHKEEVKNFLEQLEVRSLKNKEDKLSTFDDIKLEIESFSKILEKSIADSLKKRKEKLLREAYISLNDIYIKTASSMRYDPWFDRHAINSPKEFAKHISSVVLRAKKDKFDELPETFTDEQYNFQNFFIKLNLIQNKTKQLKKAYERIKQNVLSKLKLRDKIDFRWEFLATNLKNYLKYWFKDFSGVVPEEILVRLTSGVILMKFEFFRHHRVYVAFLEKTEDETAMDLGKYREIAQESIQQRKIVSSLKGRVKMEEKQ